MEMTYLHSRKQIERSKYFIVMYTEAFIKEPSCAMQLGLAVILDKPIIVVVAKGVDLPDRLVLLADRIYSMEDPENSEKTLRKIADQMAQEMETW